jgi:hypothetical protein
MEAKPIAERENFYKENYPKLEQVLTNIFASYDINADKNILTQMLLDASNLSPNQRVTAVDKRVQKGFNKQDQIEKSVSSLFQYTRLKDPAYVLGTLIKSRRAIVDYNDHLLTFEKEISTQIAALKPEKDRREGLVNKLMGDYINVKEKFQKKNFIPDANSTLRLTYGHIRGYSPADASYMRPFTTIKGILEKGSTANPEFAYPDKIRELWQTKDFGIFAKDDLKDVPVAMLYDMDTTGGNSGSPIMNAYGELIGVNFDRALEATINDYAWNESYSRSIGVDIRYVLWVASKIDNADFLLKEMNIDI